MFTLVVPPESPCGCGSGQAFGNCCLHDGKIVLSPKDIRPPGPPTGQDVRGCFLADHRNCGGRLSGDHLISAVVLRQITTEKITVTGPDFSRSVFIQDNSLKIKWLCSRHNAALSPLDMQAGRLFYSVQYVESSLSHGVTPEQRLFLFEGFDMERWLLKTLLAAYYGEVSEVNPRTHALPDNLALAFARPLPAPLGMYVPTFTNDGGQHAMVLNREATLSLMVNGPKVIGISVSLSGFTIKLLVDGLPELVANFRTQHVYRPQHINFFRERDVVTIATAHLEGSGEVVWIASDDPNAIPPQD